MSGIEKSPNAFVGRDPATEIFDDPDLIQGEVPVVDMVSHTLPVDGIGNLLRDESELEEFVSNNPYIQEQQKRGNTLGILNHASRVIVTVATKPEFIGGAALAAGAAGVIFWHKHHRRGAGA